MQNGRLGWTNVCIECIGQLGDFVRHRRTLVSECGAQNRLAVRYILCRHLSTPEAASRGNPVASINKTHDSQSQSH